MAKARAIVKRRRSVQNIRKITRTMELIATARFKKAMDRATQASAYTRKIAELVAELGQASLDVSHPLLEARPEVKKVALLVLTSNRGLAGGYNANVIRLATKHYFELTGAGVGVHTEVSGKRGISYCRFRGLKVDAVHTNFEDKPEFDQVEPIADNLIRMYLAGEIDRVDVAYTEFISAARQTAAIATILPMTKDDLAAGTKALAGAGEGDTASGRKQIYEFLPDAGDILREIVPMAFKIRLFKCFLDAAVSEQIARMTAMRGATQNADDMIKTLTRLYNRARQSQITRELADIIGGAAALE
jgi:F-type H+-transporting ATPase subunit gamma